MASVRVITANLEKGMYVRQLDRSWLETPFLFQGFEIRDDNEIRQLQQYCEFVYVSIERSSLEEHEILAASQQPGFTKTQLDIRAIEAPPPPKGVLQRIARALGRLDSTGTIMSIINRQKAYRQARSLRAEAKPAAKAYDSAVNVVTSVFDDIANGKCVDIEKVKGAVTPLIDSALRNQNAIAWLAYLRKGDNYTYNHSIASSVWAILLGRHLGFDRETLDKIAMGGMLMDVGKLKVPKELLSKPGPLTEEEFTIVQQHVDHSVEIVKQSPGIDPAIMEMIEYHHERYDGSGYPHSVGGSEIPIFGRIGGIVDCFDAMITQRTYANARSSYDAIRELNKLAGTHFQCELVEQFVQALGMFPTGSLVELNSGHVGIVTEQNSVHRLRPRLMLVLGPDKQPLRKCKGLDLRQCSSKEDQPNARWIACGHEAGAFGINVNDYFF